MERHICEHLPKNINFHFYAHTMWKTSKNVLFKLYISILNNYSITINDVLNNYENQSIFKNFIEYVVISILIVFNYVTFNANKLFLRCQFYLYFNTWWLYQNVTVIWNLLDIRIICWSSSNIIYILIQFWMYINDITFRLLFEMITRALVSYDLYLLDKY